VYVVFNKINKWIENTCISCAVDKESKFFCHANICPIKEVEFCLPGLAIPGWVTAQEQGGERIFREIIIN